MMVGSGSSGMRGVPLSAQPVENTVGGVSFIVANTRLSRFDATQTRGHSRGNSRSKQLPCFLANGHFVWQTCRHITVQDGIERMQVRIES
jgi:hypothetical protein